MRVQQIDVSYADEAGETLRGGDTPRTIENAVRPGDLHPGAS